MDLKDYKTTEQRRNAILEDIATLSTNCRDENVKATSLFRVEGGQFCQVKDENSIINLSIHAEGQLLARLNIPASYLHRCPDSLQIENVNYWLNKNKSEYLLRFDGENHVRAVFSTRYTPIDDVNLIPVVLEGLQNEAAEQRLDDLHIKSFIKGSEFTLLRVLYKSLKAEKVEKDKKDSRYYWGGVSIVNSEVGKSAIWIKPIVRTATSTKGGFDFIDRCDKGSTRLVHMGEVNLGKIGDAIKLAKRAAETSIAQLMKMEYEIVKEPAKAARVFIENTDFIANKFADIIEEEYQDIEEASRLALAESILAAVRELPTFQQYLAEGEVGRWLNLVDDIEERFQAIVQETF